MPLDDEQKLRINFFVGLPARFPVTPLSKVRHGDCLEQAVQGWPELQGSVVIVGVTARSQQDYHATPYANNYWRSLYDSSSGLMSGSEIHANVVATLQDRAYIVSPPWFLSLGILLAMGAALGWAFAQMNLALGLILAAGHHVAWKYLCFGVLAAFNFRMDIVAMMALGIVLYGVTFIQRWWILRNMLGVVKSEPSRLLGKRSRPTSTGTATNVLSR